MLWSIVYVFLFRTKEHLNDKVISFVTIFLFCYAVFIFQKRTIYLQVFAIFFIFLFYRRDLFGKSVRNLIILFCALIALPFIGLQVQGRLGETVSLGFLINHLLAIGGIENEGVVGAAGGVFQRFGWWLDLYQRWTSSMGTFLFGLGYGFPLIDFTIGSGVAVREPHNSFISTLARLGLVGGILWVWMQLLLLSILRSAHRACKQIGWREGESRLLFLFFFFVFIWIVSLVEDAFEKSYYAIPYYFFWGIVLAFAYNLKKGLIGPEKNSTEVAKENI